MLSDNDFEKICRPSATVIVAAKDPIKELGYDYRILLAKRTECTSYAPDHHVFPGGVFEQIADENPQWLDYFQTMGVSPRNLNKLSLEHLPNRPKPILTNRKCFSRDISLRITAIREVFEEVGLMLCLSREQLERPHKVSGTFKRNFDLLYWQERVHNNSREFLNMCKYLKVVPDIWSLFECSIWRSPPTSLKRYDTVVYIVTLEEQPDLLLESSEIEMSLWISPIRSLSQFKERRIWLPPMLFYEISRLCNTLCWSGLKDFVRRRSCTGCTLLMMAYFRCDDALIGILPFDDFYPENPLDHTETIQLLETCSEFQARAKNIHRVLYRDMYDMTIVCNIPSLDQHLCSTLVFKGFRDVSKL